MTVEHEDQLQKEQSDNISGPQRDEYAAYNNQAVAEALTRAQWVDMYYLNQLGKNVTVAVGSQRFIGDAPNIGASISYNGAVVMSKEMATQLRNDLNLLLENWIEA